MTAPVFAPAECAIAELALVLLLRSASLASGGGRRVGRHVGGSEYGLRLWPCLVDAVRCLDSRVASSAKA